MRAPLALFCLATLACTGKYVRPTTNEKVESTPERLARGSYLVNQAMACGTCHTTKVGNFLGGERTDMYLAGNEVQMPDKGFHVWIPNITSDVETGIGGWSDDEIIRAVRDGVGKDGRLLFPMMPFNSYRHVSDEDMRSIVAYLRSVPPVRHERKPAENKLPFMLGFMVNRGVAHQPPVTAPVPEPDRSNKVKYGEYVMRLGHCWECHSRTSRGPKDVGSEGFMAGWEEKDELPGVGVVYMRNLTPDPETGLGKYSAEQIKEALRTGRRLDGKPMAPPMSLFIPHWSGLDDEDLDALVAFLKSLKPVKKQIPERKLLPEFEKTLASH